MFLFRKRIAMAQNVRLNDVYSNEELELLLADRSDKETALRAERRLFDSYHDNVLAIIRAMKESLPENLPMGIIEMRGDPVPIYRTRLGLTNEDEVSNDLVF